MKQDFSWDVIQILKLGIFSFKRSRIGTCPSTHFTCTNSDGCTLLVNRCNTIPDCADASDESADGDCSK